MHSKHCYTNRYICITNTFIQIEDCASGILHKLQFWTFYYIYQYCSLRGTGRWRRIATGVRLFVVTPAGYCLRSAWTTKKKVTSYDITKASKFVYWNFGKSKISSIITLERALPIWVLYCCIYISTFMKAIFFLILNCF